MNKSFPQFRTVPDLPFLKAAFSSTRVMVVGGVFIGCVVLGYAGYSLLHKQENQAVVAPTAQPHHDEALNAASASGSAGLRASVAGQPAPAYLSIPEFHLRFQADNAADLSYAVSSSDKLSLVSFKSHSLANFAKGVDAKYPCDKEGVIGQLVIADNTEPGPSPADDTHSGIVAHVGGKYYYFTRPQNTCSPDSQVYIKQFDLVTVLLHSLKTVETVQ